MQVVKHEGSRAPDLAILAAAIDDGLEEIHPKVLKRVCIGPVFSRHLVRDEEYSEDPLCRGLTQLLLKECGPEDFVLFFDDEIVFSKDQQLIRKLFAASRVREVFHIPEDDLEAYKRRASVVHRNVILPHALLQHIDGAGSELPGFDECRKITYTEEGELHGV